MGRFIRGISMIIDYHIDIDLSSVNYNLKRLTNQIYKLLPDREEGIEWQRPLENIIEELAGMSHMLLEQHDILFSLLCKLKGLEILVMKEDFSLFRRTIFECLNLIGTLRKKLCQV